MSVQTILNLGDDQTVNQFQIVWPNGIPGGGDALAIALRTDTQFAPPEQVGSTYDIYHKGIKIPKSGTLTDTDKKFTLEVRLDQGGNIYKSLNAWRLRTYDPTNGTALPEAMTRTTMLVQLTDTQEKVMMTWTFTGVKLFSLTPPTLDNASGDPARITLGFLYADMTID